MNEVTENMAQEWTEVARVEDIPPLRAGVVRTKRGDIAIFHAGDDRFYALDNRCPHEGGPLSEGIVHDCRVTCPLHNWVLDLRTGEATGADEGAAKTYEVKVEDGRIFLRLGEA